MDQDNLDKILSDITVHLHPEFLIWDYQNKIDTIKIDKKLLEKYHEKIVAIKFAYKKVLRYKIYFEKFYPETENEINNTEALEHHIHAYLEDMDRLRNKVVHLLENLKKDLKHKALNKKEIVSIIDFLIKQTHEVFKNVSEHRNPHHHNGIIFVDGDLVSSEMARSLLEKNHPLHNRLKPEALDMLKHRQINSFETAKNKWIGQAEKNDVQISGFINDIIKRNTSFIHQLLKIKSIDELFDLKKPTE